jgi:predicted ATPase/transcriptional regulator with XRE-family HTH domain
MNTTETLGSLLKQYRTRRGLTQDALAEQVGCASQTVRKIEAGQRRPSPPMALRFAQILALSPDEREHFVAAAQRVSEPVLGAAPPPVAPISALPPTPTPGATLIGRASELAVLERLIQRVDVRLLTITGPGGVGKTRLAQALTTSVAPCFAHGAAWVSLAPLTDASLVLATIAQALGLEAAGGSDPRATLQAYLREQQLLLVLDNFEHVLDAAPEVTGLLEACPQLTVLVTSRAALQLRSEQVYPLGPLALPREQRVAAVNDLQSVAAVELFVQRVQHANPVFALTADNAPSVSAICRRLDGLPLALELAAPRVRLLGLSTLLARLDHVLPLLSGGARDLPARQRTIEATIRWSYDLLSFEEQALLRCLAVFAGGATLQAIEEVGAHTPVEQVYVLERLGQLVAQSLVLVDDDGHDEIRYRLLEPVRQFAQRQLAASGEEQATRTRHAWYYARWLASRGARLRGREQPQVVQEITAEMDNLRITWQHAAATRDLELIRVLLDNATYTWFFELRSWYVECEAMCRRMAEALQTPAPTTAEERSFLGNMIGCQGWFVFRCGDPVRGLQLLEEGGRLLQHGTRAIFWFHNLAQTTFLTSLMGQTQRAIDAYQHMVQVWNELDDEIKPWAKTFLIQDHAAAYAEQAPDVAHAALVEGLPFMRRVGEQYVLALALYQFGRINLGRGDLLAAEAAFAESLDVATSIHNGVCEVVAHTGLARIACARGEWAAASARCELALERAREVGDLWSRAEAMVTLAAARGGGGDHAAAQQLYRETLGIALRAQVLGAALHSWLGLVALTPADTDPPPATLTALALLRQHPATTEQIAPQIAELWERFAVRAPAAAHAAEAAARQQSLQALPALLAELLHA